MLSSEIIGKGELNKGVAERQVSGVLSHLRETSWYVLLQ
jgi:hypothetical protein